VNSFSREGVPLAGAGILSKLIHFAVDRKDSQFSPYGIASSILEKLNKTAHVVLKSGISFANTDSAYDKVAAAINDLLKNSAGVCTFCERWSADLRLDNGSSRDYCSSCEDKAVERSQRQQQPPETINDAELAKMIATAKAADDEKAILADSVQWAAKVAPVVTPIAPIPDVMRPDPSAFASSSSSSSSVPSLTTPAPAKPPRVPPPVKRKRVIAEDVEMDGKAEAPEHDEPVAKRLRLSDEEVKRIAEEVTRANAAASAAVASHACTANTEQVSALRVQLNTALARIHALEQTISAIANPFTAIRDILTSTSVSKLA